MDTERNCPSCGKPLPANAPKGLCPGCLMQAGFRTGDAPGANDPTQRAAFEPPSVAELAELFPQLEILQLLGKGGMGAVYKGRQPALDRIVALKILPPHPASDTGFAERFTREARALARLNHPNIVAVHDFGSAGPYHYFVMEYVEGGNLRELEQEGRFSPREALKIIPQICEALQYAHDEGIVHRDIKPENVMLDKRGRVKITDFGLAKITGIAADKLRLTGARDVMGTPHYMAPEQVEHPREVDHRADIYSLGVVFYEMLTGELPLGRFAAPSSKVQVDVRIDEVVLHTLEKEPSRRYQHAVEVKTDVETIASAEKSVAAPQAGRSADARLQTAATIARWTARIFSILLLLFFGTFMVIEGTPPFGSQPAGVQLNFVALGLMLGGFIIGWKKEGPAALLIASGVVLWNASESALRLNLFQTPLPVAMLYAFSWWVARGRKTGVLVAVSCGLLFAFLLGRLFLPANVFIRGTISDAQSGRAITNAEISLRASAPARKMPPRPQSRSGRDGAFSLYVGWYRAGEPVRITAPGYMTLTTTLEPRRLGQRVIKRDFVLQPEVPHGQSGHVCTLSCCSPVVVSTVPESGAQDVDPGLTEIHATFSADMIDSWSWVQLDEESFPQPTGQPRFLQGARTCVLPVKLQPGKTYALWLNADGFQNFQDAHGQASVPYLLIFKTRD